MGTGRAAPEDTEAKRTGQKVTEQPRLLSPGPEERIKVGDVRAPTPGWTGVYVGRGMPGRAESVLRNPLPVRGSRWTAEAERWAKILSTHPVVGAEARRALENQGWASGVAGTSGYRAALESLRKTAAVEQELARIAGLIDEGRVELLCWCRGAHTCHGQVIREAVLELRNKQSTTHD